MTSALAADRVVMVVPGDDPPQVQASPHLDRLKPYGEVIVYRDRPKTFEEQIERAKDAVCLMNTRSAVKWPAAALRALPRLRLIAVCGIGTDAFDLNVARERGIIVCNIPTLAPVVAEHALALMLATAKRIYTHTATLKAGRWLQGVGMSLQGKTLGVIGAGGIAAHMIRLAKAIGMEVVAWSFHPTPERSARLGVRFASLDDVLRVSDVVSVHLKLTEESRGFLGAREIGLMKRGAILVNTARGAIVDSAALVAALKTGHLSGAGLDVFDEEPLPTHHPILECDQVVLTPHVADMTPEGAELLNRGIVDNVIAFFEGRPQNVVG